MSVNRCPRCRLTDVGDVSLEAVEAPHQRLCPEAIGGNAVKPHRAMSLSVENLANRGISRTFATNCLLM